MSENPISVKRRRRWLQFSMRSVLLLTAAAAVGMAWYFAPESRQRRLGNSAAEVSESVVRVVDPNTQQVSTRLQGDWELRDEYGIVRIRGQYGPGGATGVWTLYDAEGNKQISGAVYDGLRVGAWTAWFDAEHAHSQATYQLAEKSEYERRRVYDRSTWSARSKSRTWKLPISTRTGAINVWWPNGAERIAGNVTTLNAPLDPAAATAQANQPPATLEPAHDGERAELAPPRPFDLPNGPWKSSALDKQLRSAGEYRNGARHGEWRFRDAQGVEQTVNYQSGRIVTDLAAEIEQIVPRLDASTFRERHRAMWRLLQLDDAVQPMLVEWLRGDQRERQRMAAGALGRLAVNDATAAEALALAAARADTSYDLRLSILSALDQLMIEAPQASAALNPLTEASAAFDLRTRHAAQLAQCALSPDRFEEIAERLLLEAAAEDSLPYRSAIETLNELLVRTDKSLANPLHRLNSQERSAVLRALEQELRRYDRWSYDLRSAATELITLLRDDADREIRTRAENLRLPDQSDPPPGGLVGGAPRH